MANQPKKYKKFVATAATATLVATAIVPVASAAGFSDISADYEFTPYIDGLVEQGIISGYASDNTFRPDQALTRAQVVKMLGRWLEGQGYEVPTDWNEVQRFSDVAIDVTSASAVELAKYAALVKDAGVFNGVAGKLNADQNITRENMAIVLDRISEQLTGYPLTAAAELIEDEAVTDLEKANADYHDAIQALRDLGISTTASGAFNPKGNVTRGQFAKFLSISIDTVEGIANGDIPVVDEEVGEVVLKSAKASGAKLVEVTFANAVNEEEVAISLKKGNTTVAIESITWSDDKKVATLTLNGKVSEGEYTVTVKADEKEQTASFKAENEKAVSVDFLNDKAVLNKAITEAGEKELYVAYRVLNQYGEDITRTNLGNGFTSVTSSIGSASISKGTVTVTVPADYNLRLGDQVAVTLVDAYQGLSASGIFTVSDKAAVNEIKFGEVYNSKGYKLAQDTIGRNYGTYYLPFEVVDQYGQAITKEDIVANELLLISSNSLILNVATADVTTIEIDGKETLAVALDLSVNKLAGTAQVTAISKTTGKSGAKDIEVGVGTKVDTIVLGNPEGTPAGLNDIKVPIEAYDNQGNLVTNIKLLDRMNTDNALTGSVAVTADGNAVDFEFIEEDGEFFLIFEAPSVPVNGLKVAAITIITPTQKVANKTIQIKPNARPTAIVGLHSSVSNALLAGGTLENFFNAGSFEVEDQYGNTITNSLYTIKASFAAGSENKGFSFKVDSSYAGGDVTTNGSGTVTSVENNKWTKASAKDEANSFELVAAGDATSATVVFELFDAAGNKVLNALGQEVNTNPSIDIKFSAVEFADFKSFEVDSIGTVYFDTKALTPATPADYEKTLSVYGITANGKKVKLPSAYFKVKDAKNVSADEDVDGKITITGNAKGKIDLDANTVQPESIEGSITVVINQNGEEIVMPVTVSAATPKIGTLSILDARDKKRTYIDAYDTVVSIDDIIESTTVNGDKAFYLQAEDQYGIEYEGSTLEGKITSITFTDLDSDGAVITNNGKKSASINNFEIGDSVTAKVTVEGGATITFQIKGKSGYEAPTGGAVTNQAALDTALRNGITTFDLSAFAGNTVSVNYTGTKPLVLDGGNFDTVTVNAPNATVTFNGTAQTVNITDVDSNSFVIGENGEVNVINVADSNGLRIQNKSSHKPAINFTVGTTAKIEGNFGAVTAEEGVTVTLDATGATAGSTEGKFVDKDGNDVTVEKPETPAPTVTINATTDTVTFTFDTTEGVEGVLLTSGDAATIATGDVATVDGVTVTFDLTGIKEEDTDGAVYEFTIGTKKYRLEFAEALTGEVTLTEVTE
ncbi:S-layer homology domain-containing protein [Lysinibacillus sp. LZ02]|uniref:S-layer homology domain-containing protein n=1 Tax=Lysinibacillus sp. LZ02 TaxID=3420668 RepID=UPI003D35C8F4